MTGSGGSRDDGYPATPARVTQSKPGTVGGGGAGGDPDLCDIVETAALNSLQPGAVGALNVGDILTVNLNRSGPNSVVEVLGSGGQRVGALTHRGHVRIIGCIDQGRAYVAVVLSIRGGAVEVRIEPA